MDDDDFLGVRPIPSVSSRGVDHSVIPEDYRLLLEEHGPGTLAGVLRLLSPDGPEGFNMADEQALRWPPEIIRLCREKFVSSGEEADGEDIVDAPPVRIWGILETGETLWWQPVRDDPARWLVVVIGNGWQQLNITATELLRRWAAGLLDLPVLSQGAVKREWAFTPAGQPVTVPDLPDVPRDPLAQLKTIIGPGSPVPAACDWAGIEVGLGTALPPDYKLLCEAFSPGFREGLPAANLFVVAPGDLKSFHEMFKDMFSEEVGSPFPCPGGPLLCLLSESRDQLAWDTSDPDPARWPVIDADRTFGDLGFTVFSGNLTELIVAALTYGHGIRLGDSAPGDPAHWSFPFWGPDAPWTDLPGIARRARLEISSRTPVMCSGGAP